MNKFGRKTKTAPQSGTSMTVTGLRLSTAEIVADYLKGRRPMTSPSPNSYDPDGEHSGYQSAYQEHEYLQRAKSEAQLRVKTARDQIAEQARQKEARLAELEAEFAQMKGRQGTPPTITPTALNRP